MRYYFFYCKFGRSRTVDLLFFNLSHKETEGAVAMHVGIHV